MMISRIQPSVNFGKKYCTDMNKGATRVLVNEIAAQHNDFPSKFRATKKTIKGYAKEKGVPLQFYALSIDGVTTRMDKPCLSFIILDPKNPTIDHSERDLIFEKGKDSQYYNTMLDKIAETAKKIVDLSLAKKAAI